MSNDDYAVRMFRQGDEEEVVKLLKICFKPWPDHDLDVSELDFYRWKYVDNPSALNVTSLGLHIGSVIGCNHGFTLNIKVGRKGLFGSQATDFCVHPDHRRKGVSTKISSLKTEFMNEKGINFVYAVTSNPVVIESNLRHGRQLFPHKLVELLKIRDVEKHLRMTQTKGVFLKKISYTLLKAAQRLRYIFTKINEQGIKIRKIDKFGDEVERFYHQIKDEFNFVVERDHEYLNWRFCDRRGGSYVVMVAEDDSELLGYVVLRINRLNPEYPTGWVIDLMTLPGRIDVVNVLVSHAVDFFDDEGVNVVRYWVLKGHFFVKSFLLKGFVDIGKNAPTVLFEVVNVGEEWSEFMSSPVDKLHLQIGDTEWM